MSYRAGGAMIRRRQHGRALAQTNGEVDGGPVLPTAGACGTLRRYKWWTWKKQRKSLPTGDAQSTHIF
jgi:hypothetical protein